MPFQVSFVCPNTQTWTVAYINHLVNDLVGKTKRTVIMPLKITNGSECWAGRHRTVLAQALYEYHLVIVFFLV